MKKIQTIVVSMTQNQPKNIPKRNMHTVNEVNFKRAQAREKEEAENWKWKTHTHNHTHNNENEKLFGVEESIRKKVTNNHKKRTVLTVNKSAF